MKTQPFFKSLTQVKATWGRRYKALRRLYVSKTGEKNRYNKSCSSSMVKSAKGKCGIYAACWGLIPQHSSVVFAIALITMTGVMGHKLYSQPQLQEGAKARETIVAPYTAQVEDKQKTELRRKAARDNSRQWLMVDKQINETVEQNLEQLLQQGNEVRKTACNFPFFNSEILNISTQIYLRSASEQEWKQLKVSLEDGNLNVARGRKPKPIVVANTTDTALTDTQNIDTITQKPNFKQALNQLQLYRAETSLTNLRSLIKNIEK